MLSGGKISVALRGSRLRAFPLQRLRFYTVFRRFQYAKLHKTHIRFYTYNSATGEAYGFLAKGESGIGASEARRDPSAGANGMARRGRAQDPSEHPPAPRPGGRHRAPSGDGKRLTRRRGPDIKLTGIFDGAIFR